MSRAALILATAALSVAILAGCGGEDGEEIPADDAEAMLTTVNEISEAQASGECDTALASTTELRAQAEALPDDVDSEITKALDGMISRVDEQLEAECADTGATDEETKEPEEEEEEPTEPVPTTPPPEPVPVPEEAHEEEEPPPEEETEGNEGSGNGQGAPVTPPGQSDGGAAPPTGGTEEER